MRLVTTSVASPWITLYGGTVSTGAWFTSLTKTVKLLVALRAGTPLSVTFTVIRLVLGPWASLGVQVSTPLLGSRFTPVGAETRLKVNTFAGKSESVAVCVTVSVLSSGTARPVGTVSTCALFTSVTPSFPTRRSSDLGTPLSVTFTVIRLVLGPWASLGVQVSTPLLGSRFTPVGAET